MSTYQELVKKFERLRGSVREFYFRGFQSRDQYDHVSARTYDNQRRRLENLLSDFVHHRWADRNKEVFLSFDSRYLDANPFYRLFKAKSFTDADVTLHFLLLDLLGEAWMSLSEIVDRLQDGYLSRLAVEVAYDESTVRGKLEEYVKAGMLEKQKLGRASYYRRSSGEWKGDPLGHEDALHFFSEVMPCGVIGSYLLDRMAEGDGVRGSIMRFKHHYVGSALDSEVLLALLCAMRAHCWVTVENTAKGSGEQVKHRLIPLRILRSAQSGREHLIAYERGGLVSYRLDYLSEVEEQETVAEDLYSRSRALLAEREKYMWGVNCGRNGDELETVEFVIFVPPSEGYVADRLMRERRCGEVERVDATHYRFTATVTDSSELIPWIRSFTGRIVKLNMSKRGLERRIKADFRAMYAMYVEDAEAQSDGIEWTGEEEDEHAFS